MLLEKTEKGRDDGEHRGLFAVNFHFIEKTSTTFLPKTPCLFKILKEFLNF